MSLKAKWKNYSKEELFELAKQSFNKREFFIKMGYEKYCGTTMKNILKVYPELDEILPNRKNTLKSKWKNFTKEEILKKAEESQSLIDFMSKFGYTSTRPEVYKEIISEYPQIETLVPNKIPKGLWENYTKEQLEDFAKNSLTQTQFLSRLGYKERNSYALLKIKELYPDIQIPKEDNECKWRKFSKEELQKLANNSYGMEDFYSKMGYVLNSGKGDIKNAIKNAYPDFIFPAPIASKGEYRIRKLLSTLKVNFKEQYYFNDLRGKNKQYLKFDFALFKNQDLFCLIEYQGEQHYKKIEYFKEDLLDRQKRDNCKREYCKNNKIKLIEIPYWDYDKINERYIKEKIYEYFN